MFLVFHLFNRQNKKWQIFDIEKESSITVQEHYANDIVLEAKLMFNEKYKYK